MKEETLCYHLTDYYAEEDKFEKKEGGYYKK
jgi:hypothetical protein